MTHTPDRIIDSCGRVDLLKVNDDATPYMFSMRVEGKEYTATPACVQGEGEIEGFDLTKDEARWAFGKCDDIENGDI